MSPLRRYRLLPLAALLCAATALRGQPLVQTIAPFVVERSGNGDRYLNPFSGGLVQPRIGLRDADGDGLPDLFTLNTDNRLRYYHNEGGLRFRRVFPSNYDGAPVRSWFRLEDIDADGDLDLFTAGEHSELLLYRNEASSAAPLYPQLPDTLRRADTSAIIFTQQETVPSLVDIDADGDLDLFAGDPVGTITFFRNRGTPQRPEFILESRKYMGILVLSSGGTRRKDEPVTILRHGASVLDFADLDNDGDLDMLFGDFFTEKLLLFHNDGTRQQAVFGMDRLDTAFTPNGDVVESAGFNQPVSGDIDGDGDLDVLVSSLYLDAFDQPVVLYENTAGAGTPVMRRRNLDLTSEIDLGTYSAPTTIADGARNGVLVGASDGSVTYFAVTSESRQTRWSQGATFRTNVPGLFNAVPSAGDLNGDDAAEVVIGDADGRIRLFRFRGSGNRLDSVAWQLDSVKVNSYATPTLIDFDGDGDLDLFVGAGNGRFLYFMNTGSPTAPRFERSTPPAPFDALDIGLNSSIRFGDLDGDGDLDALVGGWPTPDRQRGVVRIYLNDHGAFTQNLLYPDILTDPNPVPLAMRLDEGEFLFIGSRAGGILAFADTRLHSGVPAEEGVSASFLTASPTLLRDGNEAIEIRWNLSRGGSSLVLSDPLGREIMRTELAGRSGGMSVTIPGLAPGLYFLVADGAPACRVIVAR